MQPGPTIQNQPEFCLQRSQSTPSRVIKCNKFNVCSPCWRRLHPSSASPAKLPHAPAPGAGPGAGPPPRHQRGGAGSLPPSSSATLSRDEGLKLLRNLSSLGFETLTSSLVCQYLLVAWTSLRFISTCRNYIVYQVLLYNLNCQTDCFKTSC